MKLRRNGSTRDATAHAAARPHTLEALRAPTGRGKWAQLPRTAGDAIRLVRRAAPRELAATLVLQIIIAVVLGSQLLMVKVLIQELIAVNGNDGNLSDLLPEFSLLVGAILVMGVLNAAVQHQSRLLSERVGIYVYGEIIRVANAVGLEYFENPVFYDQLQRARTAGLQRPIEIVTSLTTITTALFATLGVGAVLLSLEPVLPLLVLLAAVPLLFASILNSQRAYTFEYALTPRNRERAYMIELLTGRDPAKEIRAFNAASYLRERYDVLTEERLAMLRDFVAKRFRVSAVAAAANAVGIAIALGSLAVFLGTGRIDVATAATAGAGMQVLSSRITALAQSLGRLVETGLFLDDLRLYLRLGEDMPASTESSTTAPAAAVGGVELRGRVVLLPEHGSARSRRRLASRRTLARS